MRLRVVSLRKVAQALESPFAREPLLRLGEYTLALFRADGWSDEMSSSDADELFLPQDRRLRARGGFGEVTAEAGLCLCIPHGWRYSLYGETCHVLVASRAEFGIARNGHHSISAPSAPRMATPTALAEASAPLMQCDTLRVDIERVAGTTAPRLSGHGAWLLPLSGAAGVRCGGVVTTIHPSDVMLVPAGCSWNLFGKAEVLQASLVVE